MKEIFVDAIGLEHRYKVSDQGNVICKNYNNTGKPFLIQFKPHHKGYYILHTTYKNKWQCFMVHDLVARAFPEICGEWFDGCVVHHLNGVKTDNRATNLLIMSKQEHDRLPKRTMV